MTDYRKMLLASMVFAGSWLLANPEKTAMDSLVAHLTLREKILSDILDAETVALNQSFTERVFDKKPMGYGVDPTGVFSNIGPHHLSNVYFPKGQTNWPSIRRFIRWTDALEPLWREMKDKYGDEITWQYVYHLATNGTRGYPWTDFSHLFGPSMNWPIRRLYPDIKSAHKIGDRFCTQPYEDNGGAGLNLSCCGVADPTGIYDDLEVYCADFALKDLFSEFRKRAVDETDCPKKIFLVSSAKSTVWHSAVRVEFSPLHNETRTLPAMTLSKELARGKVRKHFKTLELYLVEENECEV